MSELRRFFTYPGVGECLSPKRIGFLEKTMMMRMLMASLSVGVFAVSLMADQPLKAALNLDIEQARQADAIQAKYRQPFAAKR